MRTTFVNLLIEHAKKNKNVMLLTGDLGAGALEPFETQFPDRYINCGIAEQNMIAVATGLALSGKQVIIYSIGNFNTLRVLEFIRNLVCYNNADIKIVSVGAGLEYGPLGFTHHATEDIACMRAMPNMSVYSPATKAECEYCVTEMLNSKTPCYLRLNKKGIDNQIEWTSGIQKKTYSIKVDFKPQAFAKVVPGTDFAIIATGKSLQEAIIASSMIKVRYGLKVAVFSMPQLKPINETEIVKNLSKFNLVYTIEEHSVIGGLASIICEVVATHNLKTLVKPIAIKDEICYTVGTESYLTHTSGGHGYDISAFTILKDVENIIKKDK